MPLMLWIFMCESFGYTLTHATYAVETEGYTHASYVVDTHACELRMHVSFGYTLTHAIRLRMAKRQPGRERARGER